LSWSLSNVPSRKQWRKSPKRGPSANPCNTIVFPFRT